MLYREIIAACSEIHTKPINTLCGQNVELLNVKLAVHIVSLRPQKVNRLRLSADFIVCLNQQRLSPSAPLPIWFLNWGVECLLLGTNW